tara:strand:+ start:284 stop:730 length:447 start_codon:yes stop_codon:yes gene_type:complete
MRGAGYPILICAFMYVLISWTYSNLEYKGYGRAQSCSGECYEEYKRVHGTVSEQLAKQAEIAASDPFSSIRGLWAGCAACHGQKGQGMGAFPKLSDSSSESIAEMLYAYQRRETRGSMSSTMWAQASMLSDSDIQMIGDFIEAGLPSE